MAEGTRGEEKRRIQGWGRILTGKYPTLSIEITRECPLSLPGCYAYEPEHLKETGQTLRRSAITRAMS